MPSDTSDAPWQCPYMAALIGLLGDMPADRNQRRAAVVGARLDRLDGEARQGGAPETTLAAIKGARVLLEMAEMPPRAASSDGTAPTA